MSHFSKVRRWLSSIQESKSDISNGNFSGKRRYRPGLEQMEARLAPATLSEAIAAGLALQSPTVAIGFGFTLNADATANEPGLTVNGEFVTGGSLFNGRVGLDDLSDITINAGNLTKSARLSVAGFTSPTFSKSLAITIIAGSGNDTLVVTGMNGGNVTIDAGAGNDTITVRGTGDSQVEGGPGADRITSSAGNDTINGGGGDDTIFSSAGTDHFDMGSGDDLYSLSSRGTNGSSTIIGGTGSDTYQYFFLPSLQAFQIGALGPDNFRLNQTIEESSNGTDVDRLLFSDQTGHIPNNDGSQPLVGVTVDLANGSEVIPGVFTLNFSGAGGIEHVQGTPLSDLIIGDDGNNVIDGGGRASGIDDRFADHVDTLKGGGGNDILFGEFDNANRPALRADGTPRLVGAIMEGGPGDDQLISTRGDDTLRGGTGNDTYVAASRLKHGHDTIEEDGECQGTDTIDVAARDVPASIPYPDGGFLSQTNFPLDLTSTERQTATLLNGTPNLEVTLNGSKAIEQAKVDHGLDPEPTVVRNPLCVGPDVDLQIRAEHERDLDFADENQRQELTSPDNQIESLTLPHGIEANYLVKVVNRGDTPKRFDLFATETKRTGWTITYTDVTNDDDITEDFDAGLFSTPELQPRGELLIRVTMVADQTVPLLDRASVDIEVTPFEEVETLDIVRAVTTTGLVVNSEGDQADADNIANLVDADGVPDVDKNTPGL